MTGIGGCPTKLIYVAWWPFFLQFQIIKILIVLYTPPPPWDHTIISIIMLTAKLSWLSTTIQCRNLWTHPFDPSAEPQSMFGASLYEGKNCKNRFLTITWYFKFLPLKCCYSNINRRKAFCLYFWFQTSTTTPNPTISHAPFYIGKNL